MCTCITRLQIHHGFFLSSKITTPDWLFTAAQRPKRILAHTFTAAQRPRRIVRSILRPHSTYMYERYEWTRRDTGRGLTALLVGVSCFPTHASSSSSPFSISSRWRLPRVSLRATSRIIVIFTPFTTHLIALAFALIIF